MIKFKAYLALITFGFCQIAWAGLPPTALKDLNGSSGGTTFNFKTYTNQITSLGGTNNLIENSSHNLLLDPSFEGTSVTNKWTAVTVTPTLDTLNTYYDGGKQSAKISPSSQTFSLSQFVTNIPNGQFGGGNLEASCKIKTTVSGVQLCPTNGGTTLTSMCVSVPTDGNWDYVVQDFPGVASQSPGVIIQATGAVTGQINVDDCYVGVARNIGTVAQAQLIGQVKISGCGGVWTNTSTSFSSFSAQTGCTYTTSGQASAPATQIPGITFSSLPAGLYKLELEGTVSNPTSGLGAYYQFYDGTNSSPEITYNSNTATNNFSGGLKQTMLYTSPQSNITFQVRSKADSGGTASVYGTTGNPSVISVYYFPTSSQGAVQANQQTQPTVTRILSGSGTYTAPSGVTRIEVEMSGGGGGGSNSTSTSGTNGTAGGNTTFGTCTASGGNGGTSNGAGGTGGGVTTTCLSSNINSAGGGNGAGALLAVSYATGGSGGNNAFGGGAGGTTAGSGGGAGVTNTGGGGGGAGGTAGSTSNGGSGGGAGGYIHGIINFPTSYSYSVGGSGAGATGGLFTGGAGGSGVIFITEYYQGQNAPILNNSITTNANGAWRVEEAQLSNNGTTVSILSQSGSWISSCAVGGNVGQAHCTITGFSAAPACTATYEGSGNDVTRLDAHSTSTSFSTQTVTIAGTPAVASGDFEIICMGPR